MLNITKSNCLQILLISSLHKIESALQWKDLEAKSIGFIQRSPSRVLLETDSPFADLDPNEMAEVCMSGDGTVYIVQ